MPDDTLIGKYYLADTLDKRAAHLRRHYESSFEFVEWNVVQLHHSFCFMSGVINCVVGSSEVAVYR